MPSIDDILWFKTTFQPELEHAVKDTPFDLDMLTAIACQETGSIWPFLRKANLDIDRILELCVGDTLDSDKGRKAFPKTKADLVAAPDGQAMFDIARQALLDMAEFVPGYGFAKTKKNKFCHGFGIFQFDLQFFRTEPEYFLEKRYANLSDCVQKCVGELLNAMKRIDWEDKASLTDFEMACVAIAYNTGGFKPKKGLKQGHFNGSKYYGEAFFDFLRTSRTITIPGGSSALGPVKAGAAPLPPATPVSAEGPFFTVETLESVLRLRSEPKIGADPTANVIGQLPDGHVVQAVTGKAVQGFMEVETSLSGAHFRGFASTKFLQPVDGAAEIEILAPAAEPPSNGVVAVHMPRKSGTITKRSEIAGAHSLNEKNQPGRKGATPDELRAELAAIIDWLSVDSATHKRYQPRKNLTFCNIYTHDYCFLAGVYLPRVWWTPGAIEALAQGKTAEPKYGATIEEMRANDLFRWMRDFGPRFGWRQTGTLSSLQLEVNQGAIGLIVARRKQDGLSGHIVAVVPETDIHAARRDTGGQVIAPLQSQAGAVNFRYGTGKLDWWKGAQFAENAFWLHG